MKYLYYNHFINIVSTCTCKYGVSDSSIIIIINSPCYIRFIQFMIVQIVQLVELTTLPVPLTIFAKSVAHQDNELKKY